MKTKETPTIGQPSHSLGTDPTVVLGDRVEHPLRSWSNDNPTPTVSPTFCTKSLPNEWVRTSRRGLGRHEGDFYRLYSPSPSGTEVHLTFMYCAPRKKDSHGRRVYTGRSSETWTDVGRDLSKGTFRLERPTQDGHPLSSWSPSRCPRGHPPTPSLPVTKGAGEGYPQ